MFALLDIGQFYSSTFLFNGHILYFLFLNCTSIFLKLIFNYVYNDDNEQLYSLFGYISFLIFLHYANEAFVSETSSEQ